jgi:gluconate 2-dehydrogenase subunit 3-like protein
METRRDTLKIIGAIGSTCAFPFSSNDLYGQQEHHHPVPAQVQPPRGPFQPKFFTAAEYETVSRIADLIIPRTDTPGAVEAGVPEYIDYVVSHNEEHQKPVRGGLEWLDRQAQERHGNRFVALTEEQQIELLAPLSDAVDRGQAKSANGRFFHMIKSMTADGYYTSQIGLVRELGYKGNTALSSFPGCNHPEHA